MVSDKEDEFVLLADCYAAETIPVKKYRSARTGLTVIVAGVPGPLVYGSFFVATEAFDDDGLPHTLEHLIFLGSADYPYKGTLDILANRCLASGTNAWTDIDHTAYTVSTAGSEGFLNLLPVYLDHLFFPTLTDAGFVTEVYHVTGEGKDAGVVFCEMRGVESNDSYVTCRELLRALYKPNSGYRYDTGGAVHNLRYSTNNEKIRKFHKQFYCPLNTTIVVAGPVDIDKLLGVCRKFEEKLISKGCSDYKKAWQTPVEPLEKSVIRAVTYQSDEEDNGYVCIGWQGPSLVNEYYQFVASNILFNYLTETSASPLMKYFVEVSDPYCSDISVDVSENSIPAFSIQFENAVIPKMPCVHEELMELLQKIVDDNDSLYRITGDRMTAVIEKYALQELLTFEKDPHNELALKLVRDTLYGQSLKDLEDKLNIQKLKSRLLNEPITFWISLLNDHFVKKPSATVLGYPWKNQEILQTQLENERLAFREATYGIEGLKEKDVILKKAIEENNVMPPDELINSVPFPAVDLKYHSVCRYTTCSEKQHENFNISSSPVYTQLDDLDSKFVYAYVVMDSRTLPRRLSFYSSLFLEYITSCPIRRDGKIIPHEQVAEELEQDLITLSSCIGLFCKDSFSSGAHSYALSLSMVMTEKNFGKGMNWIRSLLYDSVFTHERLLVTLQKMVNSISQVRRQGSTLVLGLMKMMIFNHANHRSNTVLSQQRFLNSLIKKLEDEKEREHIINDLEEIRRFITNPENIILHLSTNVQNLVKQFPNADKFLSCILPENAIPNQKRFDIYPDSEFLTRAVLNLDEEIKSCVVGMATEDASFMQHVTSSIRSFNDFSLPALLVCIHYLTQLEGPLWRNIRGFGLAYGYRITLKPDEGTLTLMLYRSTDIVQAFSKTKKVVMDIINSGEWSSSLFEAAKGALIFDIVNEEKNIASVSRQSLLSYFHDIPEDYNQKLIGKIQDVRISQLQNVADLYLKRLFDPETSLSAIVCHSSKYEQVSKDFKEMGHELVAFPSLEDSYLTPAFIDPLLERRTYR